MNISVTKRRLVALSLILLLITSACTSKGAVSSESPGNGTNATDNAPVNVVWWHAMGGESGKALDKLVADFNTSQNKVHVEPIYQGSYDELLNKLKASIGSKDEPTMVQMNEVSSRFMIDSNAITPIQQFIDKDKFDVKQLEPNITSYYSFDNTMYSMPFNVSAPILYYNKDMFKQSGLDPAQPPQTFDDIYTAAKAITKDGKAGISIAISGWFMEEFFASQGADYLNNANGRNAPATQSLLNEKAGLTTLEWWKKMNDEKVNLNLGRKIADARKAFLAGQIGMTIDSTAAMKSIVDGANGKFEVGTAFFPKPSESKDGGVVTGGGSLYIMKNQEEQAQEGAWDFIRFLVSPEQQAYWHVNTGYFPVSVAAYELESVKENMNQFPQFQTAVNQLRESKINSATQGAVMGIFADARLTVEDAIESVLTGTTTPKDALDSAALEIDSKLEKYNKTVQR